MDETRTPEYIRSCEELWQKGLYVELHAYQHHVFMDWRFVDDSPKGMLRNNWGLVNSNLNGAGVESMQGKWDEMFGEKKEEVMEEVKVRKPRKKAVLKKVVKETKKATTKKKTAASKAGEAKSKSPAKTAKKAIAKKIAVKRVVKKKGA